MLLFHEEAKMDASSAELGDALWMDAMDPSPNRWCVGHHDRAAHHRTWGTLNIVYFVPSHHLGTHGLHYSNSPDSLLFFTVVFSLPP
jgi:hypothetical protein